MQKLTLETLIEDRARILAMVQFTSRHDLQASSFPEDGGLDLLVRIVSEGEGYQKLFGVELKGTNQSLSSSDQATRFLRSEFEKSSVRTLPKYSFPVIVLLFSMRDDKGYYAWSIEPLVNQSSEPRLKLHETLVCAPFNRSSLAKIVERVKEWHDSLVALLENV